MQEPFEGEKEDSGDHFFVANTTWLSEGFLYFAEGGRSQDGADADCREAIFEGNELGVHL